MKYMKQKIRIYYVLFLLVTMLPVSAWAQIRGVVTDSVTNEPLMLVSIQYTGTAYGTRTDENGEYRLSVRPGLNEVTFSYMGYVTKTIRLKPGTTRLDVRLRPDDIVLQEVVVKPKKERYRRKNNPAVDFMRKVIEHKKALRLEENDYYQYRKYEKMKMSLNDITPEKMEKGLYKKFAFFKDQVEESALSGKLILPISIKETASRTLYRKDPKSKASRSSSTRATCWAPS